MGKRHIFLLGLIFVLGCGGDVEKKVDTAHMVSDFAATRNKNSVICSAAFHENSRAGAFLELTGGDQVWCQGNMMVKKQDAKTIWYETEVALEQNEQYTLSFRRPGEKPYLALVSLPSAVKILKPHQGEKLEKGRDITIEVTPGEKNLDTTVLHFNKNEDGVIEPHSDKTAGDVTSHKIDRSHTNTKGSGAVAEIIIKRMRAGTQPTALTGNTWGFSVDKINIELQ